MLGGCVKNYGITINILMNRIYISGAMASRMETYKEIFDEAQSALEKLGAVVINPAVLPKGLDSDKYMPICLAMLDAADAIYMLKGWENSRGALLEKAYAEYQGKEVLYEE